MKTSLKQIALTGTFVAVTGLELLVAGCATRDATPAPSSEPKIEIEATKRFAEPLTSFYIPPYVSDKHAREYENLVVKAHKAINSNGYFLKFEGEGYDAYRFAFLIKYSNGDERFFSEFELDRSRIPDDVKRGEQLAYAWVDGKMGDISSIVSVKGLTGNPILTTTNRSYDDVIREARAILEIEFPVKKFVSDLQSAAPYGAGREYIKQNG